MTTKLTKEKAIELSIELWTYLAEFGDDRKDKWPKWHEVREKYGPMAMACPLCEYAQGHSAVGYLQSCARCPYSQTFGNCCGRGSPYRQWTYAEEPKARRKLAFECLSQLRQL